MTGIALVLTAAKNSPTEVARKVSTPESPCSRQLVEYWIRKGYVPGVWAPRVHEVYGVPLHLLNPKIYPNADVRRPGRAIRSAVGA